MERQRRCGWLGLASESNAGPGWVSRLGRPGEPRVSSEACPVNSVTGDSKAFVEIFWAEKRLGARGPVGDLPARTVDALLVLEREMTLIKEGARGE